MARILFIACDYYSYTDRIEAEMRAQGHEVRRMPIEPRGARNKALRRFLPAWHRRSLDAHHAKLLRAVADETYDQVVFLQVHQFSVSNLEALRAAQGSARFVLYNWDSIATHDYRAHLIHFDKAATFDPADAQALGIDYLPLFALPEFFEVAANRQAPEHDIYFVGSVHSLARYEAVKRLHAYCRREGLRLKLHLHCSPPRMAQLIRTGRWLPGMTLRSIGTEEILAMMRSSMAVFDFASQRQSGLTMRIFENLAAGVKIIATNPRIAEEPFYSPDRILVLRDLDFAPVKAFLARPSAGGRQFEEYILSKWLAHLLA